MDLHYSAGLFIFLVALFFVGRFWLEVRQLKPRIRENVRKEKGNGG